MNVSFDFCAPRSCFSFICSRFAILASKGHGTAKGRDNRLLNGNKQKDEKYVASCILFQKENTLPVNLLL